MSTRSNAIVPAFTISNGASCRIIISKAPKTRSSSRISVQGTVNETLILKRRFSAFFATDLALFLTEQKVERVIIAGVKTNVCIRATAQDAFANGFAPVLVREATNSNRPIWRSLA